jgi:hypothetical protein
MSETENEMTMRHEITRHKVSIKELEQENAELKRIIAESQKQEPVGYLYREQGRVMPDFHYKQSSHEGMMPVFASPVIQEGMQLVGYVNKCDDYTGSVIPDDKDAFEESTVAVYAMLNASKEIGVG